MPQEDSKVNAAERNQLFKAPLKVGGAQQQQQQQTDKTRLSHNLDESQQQRQQRKNENNKSNRNPNQQFGQSRTNAASSGAAAPSATSQSGAKIDSDLLNVANENRVILNVGGIRHETYKVSQ